MYGAAFLLLILFAELSVEHGALSSVSVYGDCLLPFEQEGITGSVLLIIFRSLISLCFITCLIRISFNLKNDQKNRPHDPEYGHNFKSGLSLFVSKQENVQHGHHPSVHDGTGTIWAGWF